MFKKAAWSVFGGATVLVATYECYNHRRVVKASWTTHYNTPEPQVKWDYNWDRRQVDLNQKSDTQDIPVKPTATRHIFLIRHGQYSMTSDCDKDRILTPLGREQAELTGKRLKSLNLPVTKIIMSTMTRAQETGFLIAKSFPEVPVEHCDLLREGAPIPPEPPINSWRPEAQFFQDGARIEAAFRKYFHRANVEQKDTSYELMVCHANVIRYFICRALQLPPEAWLRISLHNGSVTWLAIRPNGRVSLRLLGDCGFMEPEKLSTT